MGNECQEQYTPGLTNNRFRHFYAIATITQSFKKVCLRRHLCLLKCMILEIIIHCNINIKKKLCLSGSRIWGRKSKNN